MATRQEDQVAKDLIRDVNIINDLIDVAAYMMQEIDAQIGGPLLLEEILDNRTGLPFLSTATPAERAEFGVKNIRPYTFDELKVRVVRICQNIQGYKIRLVDFFDSVDQEMVVNGLAARGIDALKFKNELLEMNAVRDYVATNLSSAATKVDLIVLGQYIDANVPKLTLVRRSWCLGI